ncbi:hypothetical protein BZG74_02200 [Salinivibrio sharmensis]|uniref:Uncharacterized protein n=1 Tax=Salinivibrio sharmensis TaxID=390883 RepID=A0ABX3KJJ8_9GAMM|nr:hypothetical protein BZG74_02200 [Salinivibrio sharmensis]
MALFSLFHQDYPLYTTFSHPEVYVAGKKKVKQAITVTKITLRKIKEIFQRVNQSPSQPATSGYNQIV